ncbi:MAG: hypothetical protein KIT20_14505 [Alphaproteobacteria bacterium]|nr:hypothetical protein [Alphaproteobacteria bacterium]
MKHGPILTLALVLAACIGPQDTLGCFDFTFPHASEREADRNLKECFPAGSSLPVALLEVRRAGLEQVSHDRFFYGGARRVAYRFDRRISRAPGVIDDWRVYLVHEPGDPMTLVAIGARLVYLDQNFPARGVPFELSRFEDRRAIWAALLHLVEKPVTDEGVWALMARLGGAPRDTYVRETDVSAELNAYIPRLPLPPDHIYADQMLYRLGPQDNDPAKFYQYPQVRAQWRFDLARRQFLELDVFN